MNFCLTSNFTFNNEQYRTEDSGPNGLRLMVTMAQIYMSYITEEASKKPLKKTLNT